MNKNSFRIYADECIDKDFIEHLIKHGVNIKGVEKRDKGLNDKEQYFKTRITDSFLLTYNKKHFLDINKFDFSRGGIIILETDNPYEICGLLRNLISLRNLEVNNKIYLIDKEGITVISKEGKGKIINGQNPCLLCNEKCKSRIAKKI